MRTFIAIEIPDAVKQEMAKVQDQLRGSGVQASWTRPEGIHLTLKFLGEIDESKTAAIMDSLTPSVAGTGGCRLDVMGVGTFPNPRNARVAWLGIAGDVGRLKALQRAVEEGMTGIGFKREARTFSPHLTLGRIKGVPSREQWLRVLEKLHDVELPGFDVDALSLMKSELKPSGAVYTEIGRIALA